MSIRAKFKVTSKTRHDLGEVMHEVCLSPVTTGSEENESFYKYTPGGDIKLSVLSPATDAAFEVGKSYYVDFTEAAE